MDKKILLMAGAAFLFVGVAQAETPVAPSYDDPGYVNGGHFEALAGGQRESDDKANPKEAAAPASVQNKGVAAFDGKQGDSEQDLHPDARPVYNNGGHWGV